MKIRKKFLLFFLIFCGLIWSVFATTNFIASLKKIEDNISNQTMSGITDGNAAQVRFAFDQYTKTLSSVAKTIENQDDFTSPDVLSVLNDIAAGDVFARLAIDFANGTTYTSDGHMFDITKFDYAHKISEGNPFIVDVVDAIADGTPVVSVVVPIKNSLGVYEAGLRGAIPTDTLTNVFNKTFSNPGGYYYIVDEDGRYISKCVPSASILMDQNYFEAVDHLSYFEGYSSQQLKDSFVNKTKGMLKYSYDGEARYTYYAPVDLNNWVVFMIVPQTIVDNAANMHVMNAIWLVSQIAAVFLLFLLYVYFIERRAKNTAQMNETCLKLLAEQTKKTIIEWDFGSDDVGFLSNFKRLFGGDDIDYNPIEQKLTVNAVHEEDKGSLDLLYDSINTIQNISNIRLRILSDDNKYHWCDVSITFVRKQNGKPYKAVGFIENIDEQVKYEDLLRKKSEVDQLTGLYNKATAEHLIANALEISNSKHDQHALMIIDIDNYKYVNDHLGHLYGDIVLSQLSSLLQSTFRSTDIIGRLGGDEFFALVKNFDAKSTIAKIAEDILEKFSKTYTEGDVSTSISASVGISIWPHNGIHFEDLYKAADIALYNVKASGKNNYDFYDGLRIDNYISDRTDIDVSDTMQKNFFSNKAEYIFKLLYGSENSKFAISTAVQLIAEQFGFSMANILKIDHLNNNVSCIFEWSSADVFSIQNTQPNILLASFYEFATNQFLKTTGMTVKPISDFPEDIQMVYASLSVKSLVYFTVMDGEKLLAIISFHDCVNERPLLSALELEELNTICQVLEIFVFKQYLHYSKLQHSSPTEIVLNNIDTLAYVVDKENFRLLFENERVRKITGHSNEGKICYEVFHNTSSPCKNCPIHYITNEQQSAVVKISNHDCNGISKTTASEICWHNDEKAYLISSVDITEYKNNV